MVFYRNVFYLLGIIFLIFSGLMVFPAIVDVCLKNDTGNCFVISSIFCCFFGGLLFFSNKSSDNVTYLNTKEKTILLILAWITLPLLSMLPFVLSPFSVSFINSLFEATAAITTTGSSTVDLKNFSDGFLLWRAILQFSGGIFFIFTYLYIFPSFKLTYNANMTDISGYSNDKIPQYIKNIVIVYLFLALISSFVFVESGLSTLDSICYSFAAISSGGLISDNVYNISDVYHRVNWILSLLMFIGGCSCGLINKIISNGISALNNKQFICYSAITISAIILLTLHIFLTSAADRSVLDCLEKSVLIATSSITTTGINIDTSRNLEKFVDILLYILNFCGGCSGSCTGGIKIFRIMMVFIILKTYFTRLVKTNSVYVPLYEKKRIGEFEVNTLFVYFISYLMLCVLFSLMLSFSGIEYDKAVGAALTTMNNNGPFLGLYKATSPQIALMSSSAKSVLIAAMIAGRVEFILFFMVISKAFWKN